MKIVCDENLAFATEAFVGFGTVLSAPGRAITPEMLADADALIVRSITRVDEQLLQGSPVSFVGTATIGTNHIDKDYLQARGIRFADAKGCNADAVTEYILSAIYRTIHKRQLSASGLTVGIIGCGNIGGRLWRLLTKAGFTVIANDPPLQRLNGGVGGYSPLADALGADIITFHTPLNNGGVDNTYHLLNADTISRLQKPLLLCNASRGEVINTKVLLDRLSAGHFFTAMDVWEDEPRISGDLLAEATFTTPHIAGYTYEGKVNGTMMIRRAMEQIFPVADSFEPPQVKVDNPVIDADTNLSFEAMADAIFSHIYDIESDTEVLKQTSFMSPQDRGLYFDQLRKDYRLRREFTNYSIRLQPYNHEYAEILRAFRFTVL